MVIPTTSLTRSLTHSLSHSLVRSLISHELSHSHAHARTPLSLTPTYHAHNRAAAEVLAKAVVERLLRQVNVVLLSLSQSGVHHLDRDQLVPTGLEAADHLPDNGALHAVRLHGNERALVVGSLRMNTVRTSIKRAPCT